jgi:two-component system sensor histidine kinase AlgZ
MKDTQILSAFQELGPDTEPAGPDRPAPALVFDACQIGVVLRSVLFVELAIAAVVMFDSPGPLEWLGRLSLMTGAGLPAVLSWLLLACMAKRLLARLKPAFQYVLAALLGAVAAVYGCGLLALTGLLVNPPWLASAFSGMLLSSVLVVGLVLRAKGRTPAQTAARLTELQSRIRPHFLFNTLNSAIALVRAEPAKAETLLEDLSDLFRQALVDQGESVTLADEIALARRYLAIEQIRFGERLQVEWRLDPAADAARLPPLLLQPLVENAVRHGVEPSPSGAQLRISTQRRGAVVVIKVSNTVPAGPGPAGSGLALRNVRERLSLLHDLQGQFRSGSQDGLFQVRLEVPA